VTTKNPGPMYPNLEPWDLEPHYCAHIGAMTTEGLHSKAAIAEQLAWRDQTIEQLRRDLANAIAVNSGRTYCRDSPGVLKARVVELERELADAKQARQTFATDLVALADGKPVVTMLAAHVEQNLAEARAIGELERAVVNAALVWNNEPEDSVGAAIMLTGAVGELMEMLAARAATGEKEADRG